MRFGLKTSCLAETCGYICFNETVHAVYILLLFGSHWRRWYRWVRLIMPTHLLLGALQCSYTYLLTCLLTIHVLMKVRGLKSWQGINLPWFLSMYVLVLHKAIYELYKLTDYVCSATRLDTLSQCNGISCVKAPAVALGRAPLPIHTERTGHRHTPRRLIFASMRNQMRATATVI